MKTKRLAPMPATQIEQFFSRFAAWPLVVANGLLAGLALVSALVALAQGSWETGLIVVLIAFSLAWTVLTAFMYVLAARKYRHTRDSLEAANQGNTADVLIPGSSRVPTMMVASTVAMAIFFVICLVAAGGQYWVLFVVLIVVTGLSALPSLYSLRRRRFLRLSPQGVESSGFRSHATVAWGDIDRITFATGMAGQMVFRLTVTPGAPSFVEHSRQRAIGRHSAVIDVEPLSLDLDPLLLGIALRLYWKTPAARSELSGKGVPERFTEAEAAVASVPQEISQELLTHYRPEKPRR